MASNKTVNVQYTGRTVFRGADQFRSASLTVEPGDVVEMSVEKFDELTKKDEGKAVWKQVDAPEKPAESGGGAMSSANTATK